VNDAVAITNLLYRYAELMDAGELEQVAALFAHARVTLGGGLVVDGAAPMLEQWRAFVRIHPCGTPRTRHVITNPIIEIDEAAGTAKTMVRLSPAARSSRRRMAAWCRASVLLPRPTSAWIA